MWMHGGGKDGANDAATQSWAGVKAPFIQIVEEGHDVYWANNRGTEYAVGHTTLDSLTDETYWNFSWGDFPQDILAIAEVMYNSADAGKGYYIGYS